ncbi:MAG: 16S rRNA (guanine(527)-N(7))-methyltransferase RsmG [Veillonella sp.]|nr:16S rRNA (guanine(527)-N(7))-methyltransferase RsmG [Veillonella sp.]
MKEKYDVPIAPQSEFVSYMMEQMSHFGLPCTEEQAKDFYMYYAHMIETNKYLNLTGITDMKEVVVKHMIDSLSCYDSEIIKSGMTIIDVGTGAGFPGIPLAIYDRSLKVTLFDSLKKRLTFLESIIDKLKLTNCTTLHGRAEDLSHQDYRESFDIATSRAVARLPILLEWTVVKESNKALSTLKATIEEVRTVTLPTLDDKRAILYMKKTGKTPKQYPRKPKEIKDKPLV